jgi:hypothetical protein
MGGGRKASIAAAPTSAFRREPAFAIMREVVKLLARLVVVDRRAHGNLDGDSLAFMASPVAALAVPASLRRVFGIEAEMQESVLVDGRLHDDIAAAAAIAAAGTATRNVFLAAERQTAIAAIARFDRDSYFIYKHDLRPANNKKAAGSETSGPIGADKFA